MQNHFFETSEKISFCLNNIAEYHGRGTAIFSNNIKIDGVFWLYQSHDGKIIFEITEKNVDTQKKIYLYLAFRSENLKNEFISFEGSTEDHSSLSIKKDDIMFFTGFYPNEKKQSITIKIRMQNVDIKNTSKSPTLLKFGLTNLLFEGDSLSFPSEQYNKITIIKVHNYREIVKIIRDKHNIAITSLLGIHVEKSSKLSDIFHFVDELCELLSIMRGFQLNWLWYEMLDDEGDVIQRTHADRIVKSYSPIYLIDPQNTEATVNFIVKLMPDYHQIRQEYMLNTGFIAAYLEVKQNDSFLQSRGIRAAVTLEMLKKVVLSNSDILNDKILKESEFKALKKEIKSCIKTLYPSDKEKRKALSEKISEINRTSFKEILIDFFNKIGFDYDPKDLENFIHSRNSLIHQGEFYCITNKNECDNSNTLNEMQTNEYFFLINFLDKIILTLLGYKGKYYNWRTIPAMEEDFG